MTTRVMKFGGTSVGSLDRIRACAAIVAAECARGERVAVVVSAMAGETDRLLSLAGNLGFGLGDEETDVVLSAGEQISAALMSMALSQNGLTARSFLGWQARIRTDGPPGSARISGLDASPMRSAMDEGCIPVMAGFQGASINERVRTLGRGGTDLSAVALAAALGAHCDIYTDVDGVFTTDPRIEPKARRIDKISYDEMLELAAQGAKVLQTRSAEFAKARSVPLRVLSSFAEPGQSEGTMIMQAEDIAERRIVSGIAYARDQARIALRGLSSAPGAAAAIFGGLADADIGIDMIVQSPSSESGRANLEFTVDRRDLDKALVCIGESDAHDVLSETGLAKVSVVGLGLNRRADVARILYGALARQKIAIRTVSTSEIKISVLIENDAVENAVRALHAAYGLDDAAV
ncbi:aspartate kinase [Hyphobacterium sp. CCMP332]|uniref:aspartate kinase n=1 Tax=Hyphobacterium sp. CCMP332 TaxID=2749086 RepID=UPI001650D15F|nr:aspartate kinase [Hyphobacterium sp. CCMP332]QNL18070.1 aspartate kinase [Hyphobacterium sp. CCMP332]